LDRLERPPGVAAGAGGLVHAALAATPCARPHPVDTRTGQAGDAPVGERVATGIARQYRLPERHLPLRTTRATYGGRHGASNSAGGLVGWRRHDGLDRVVS